jgi:DNA polymerase III subunit delta
MILILRYFCINIIKNNEGLPCPSFFFGIIVYMNALIYGNENYLLDQALQKRLKSLINIQDTMNTVFYDASGTNFSMLNVIEEAQTLPFFSEHKVLVIQNCTFLTRGVNLKDSDLNELVLHLSRPIETCTLIFMHDNDNLDTQKKITKKLLELCSVEHVKKLETNEFRQFLMRLLKEKNIKMNADAFEEFLKRMDNNMSVSYHEAEKLSIYGSVIGLADVEALISRPLDNEAFHLVNALMDKNLKQALHIYNDMMILNMEPLSFSGLIASQLRLLYQVASLDREGYHRQDMINKLSPANNVNVYRLNKMLALARHTSPDRILSILNYLSNYDHRSKIGLVDKKFGFELFLIEATH